MIARAGLVLVVVAGCSGSQLSRRADTVAEVIATARDHGAVKCAPVELAMAETHHEFAEQELFEGNYYRARSELGIAEKNAHLAVARSPVERCAPRTAPADRDGDGILDDVDGCPDDPEDKDGFEDDDGCPDPDNDGDGVLDVDDECPDDPEDIDSFEDGDGCPDGDNDGDGLADSIDGCPDDPEDKDGFEDDDGCPDCDDDGDGVPECPDAIDRCPTKAANTPDGCPRYKNVVVTKKAIELRQTVYFDTGRATIKPISHGLLDEVATALEDHPDIVVRIEGHTDSRGSKRFNLGLSQRRAESVRTYLIGRGIDPDRMTAKGHGESQPIADNRTRAGREQNRRVVFAIVSQ